MSAPNIVWTRVDERLLHGQIRITWGKTTGANLILVANDEAAEGPNAQFMQAGMKSSAGGEYAVRFFTLQKTIEVIHKASPKQMILILCNCPADVATLVEGGVPIKYLNVGNMHFREGRKEIAKFVNVDETDVEAFRRLKKAGVECDIQILPDNNKENAFTALEKAGYSI